MDLKELLSQFKNDLKNISSLENLEAVRLSYAGKKGALAKMLKDIANLSAEEKKTLGKKINEAKQEIQEKIAEAQGGLAGKKSALPMDKFLKTLPGKKPVTGHLHIISQAISEIVEIFKPLGFTRARYPEIDWEYFAFEALNIPSTHPARDEWETFFIDAPVDKKFGRQVITPHTSNGQVREMLKGNLPIRMLNISRCGRRQEDASHLQTFFQFEGLAIDKGVSITHLKGTLEYFVKNFFGPKRKIRLRPYDFRFTEPSFEVDINCDLCGGAGCKFCKGGWVELGGAGMVHPNVLKAGGIDPNVYTGFAFGWGIERVYMMKGGIKIDDIRHLVNNDLRFLEQF
ncbi:MAG: phenylalanine--tRNA ligase subunit alpha [Candidatus Portnoybacteria bacterium]|nr:phenylalanine--tRNA ligase subunit alpha [Candidatus Portnoybacteria bacterium]MDD4982641.1 phenylalanine--tRNA ligase subunit alpha [Candidatus Portnoybacteria bacterium]